MRFQSPRDAIRLGIGLLPQDRKAQGFVPDMSVAGNISLASLPMFSRFSILNERKENDAARALASRLGMRIFGVEQPMKTLSGGTQQKGILARWLVRSARVLICDEPTRGVDVGAKEDMYELIRDFARSGGTVIIASSEISETMMCDRVLVMAKGRVVAALDHDEIDRKRRSDHRQVRMKLRASDDRNAIGRSPLSTNSEHAVRTLGHSAARDDARTTFKRVLGKSYLFLVLLLIIIVGHIVSPNFLTVRNASNVIAFSSIIALLAVGQFYVILTGGIDLSVGAILALSTVIAACC